MFLVWHNIKIQHHAKYLGVILGPFRGDFIYDKPLSKFAQRAKDWSAEGSGLALATIACSVCFLFVLLFVAQLESPLHLGPRWKQVPFVVSFQGQPIGTLQVHFVLSLYLDSLKASRTCAIFPKLSNSGSLPRKLPLKVVLTSITAPSVFAAWSVLLRSWAVQEPGQIGATKLSSFNSNPFFTTVRTKGSVSSLLKPNSLTLRFAPIHIPLTSMFVVFDRKSFPFVSSLTNSLQYTLS